MMKTNAKKLSLDELRAEFGALAGAAGANGAAGADGGANSGGESGADGGAWCGFIQMSDLPVMIIGGAGKNNDGECGDEVADGADSGGGGDTDGADGSASQSWQNAATLPSWDELHNGANFINEAQLFRAKNRGVNGGAGRDAWLCDAALADGSASSPASQNARANADAKSFATNSNLGTSGGENGANCGATALCPVSGECVTIRHFNGEFWFSRFDLDDVFAQEPDKFEFERKVFVALDGRAARFLRVWEARADVNCEGLEVLTPAGTIFVGFVK